MHLIRIVFASVLIAACGGSKPVSEAPRATVDDPSCPVAVAGTSVSVEDDAEGAALVFVTTGDVTELRRRVAAMAMMHNDHHGAMGALPEAGDDGGGHAGHDVSGHAGHDVSGHAGHDMGAHAGHAMGGGAHAGHAGGMIGVHSKATATDIDGGARLSFVSGAADVGTLQSELRMHAQHLSGGTCAMSTP
jgi:hypothetical protein